MNRPEDGPYPPVFLNRPEDGPYPPVFWTDRYVSWADMKPCYVLAALVLAGCGSSPTLSAQVAPSEVSIVPASYPYGFPATVQQRGGDTSGSMELTVEVPKPGDPAMLFDPLPDDRRLVVTFVTARGVSGAPYLRAPGFHVVTTSGRHIAAGTLLQRGHLSSGTLQAGELRDGLVSFSIPGEEDVTEVVWYSDDQSPTASWG